MRVWRKGMPTVDQNRPPSENAGATVRVALLGTLLFLAAMTCFAGVAFCSMEFAGGLAFPDGFFDYGFSAYAEQKIQYGLLPPFVSPAARASGYFSYKDNVRLAVGSASLLLKLTTPQPVSGFLGLSPYVSAGPSFNYLYSWADLDDFGSMSKSETSTTFNVFAGAEFFSTSSLSFFVEARSTVPSDFTFDYVLVGLKLRGSSPPSIY